MAKPLLDIKQQRKIMILIRRWTTKLTWSRLIDTLDKEFEIKISRQSLQNYKGIKAEYDNKKAELRGATGLIVKNITQSDVKLVERIERLEKENQILTESCDKQLALIRRIFANASEIPNLDINDLTKPRTTV